MIYWLYDLFIYFAVSLCFYMDLQRRRHFILDYTNACKYNLPHCARLRQSRNIAVDRFISSCQPDAAASSRHHHHHHHHHCHHHCSIVSTQSSSPSAAAATLLTFRNWNLIFMKRGWSCLDCHPIGAQWQPHAGLQVVHCASLCCAVLFWLTVSLTLRGQAKNLNDNFICLNLHMFSAASLEGGWCGAERSLFTPFFSIVPAWSCLLTMCWAFKPFDFWPSSC